MEVGGMEAAPRRLEGERKGELLADLFIATTRHDANQTKPNQTKLTDSTSHLDFLLWRESILIYLYQGTSTAVLEVQCVRLGRVRGWREKDKETEVR